MDKKLLEELKSKLEEEKKNLEESLQKIAKKDPRATGGWRTKFPKYDGGNLEEEADEAEEYQNLLSQETSLEERLKEVSEALEKIKKKGYGICERCGKEIDLERLKVCPEAKTCLRCK